MGCGYTSPRSLEKATLGVRQLNRLGESVSVFFLSIHMLMCNGQALFLFLFLRLSLLASLPWSSRKVVDNTPWEF